MGSTARLKPKNAKKNLKQRKCKKNVKTLWNLQKMSVVLNQRIQIQCQECSGADLISDSRGAGRLHRRRDPTSVPPAGASCPPGQKPRPEGWRGLCQSPAGIQRPVQRSIIFSAKNVLDIYTAEDSQYKSCTLIFTNM